jgi:hypothetical protein
MIEDKICVRVYVGILLFAFLVEKGLLKSD